MFRKLHVLGMSDDFGDRIGGVGSATWKGREWTYHYSTTCDCMIMISVYGNNYISDGNQICSDLMQ